MLSFLTARSACSVAAVVGLALCVLVRQSFADVRLPAILDSHMVLQRETQVPLWGWAESGEEVRVKADWLDDELTATAGDDGAWRVKLQTPKAGGPHQIEIRGKNTITLRDVLIGEVWLCSGQSNMEWPLSAADNAAAELAAADHPEIRLFHVTRSHSLTPREDCAGKWAACDADSAKLFTAVGYFFGRELNRELGVPIGLIESSWGGTVAEAWCSEAAMRAFGEFDHDLKTIDEERANPGSAQRAYEAEAKKWLKKLDRADEKLGGKQWASEEFDDSGWSTVQVPGAWPESDLVGFDGVAWIRTPFDVPKNWERKALVLELGPIDDMDTTYINGVEVGSMMGPGYWNTPRQYKIEPQQTHVGKNVLAIRVIDTGGPGGLIGKPEQLRVYPRNDESAAILLAGEWRYKIGTNVADLPPQPQPVALHENTPTVLYNGMISPILGYGMRGVIWYQGESNRPRARQYRRLFPALIEDWRKQWSIGDFPFYFVQIAPYLYGPDHGEAAELREAQFMTLATPNTGMAVTLDIGNPRDIHPTNKQEVGRRLSLWALAKTYGRDEIVYSGPLYKSMKVEGGAIRVSFDYVDGGLESSGGLLSCFTIAGEDRVFHPATATIDDETIVVKSDEVAKPIAVRFAWGQADEPNLRNAAGLPASSFRTDDWSYASPGGGD